MLELEGNRFFVSRDADLLFDPGLRRNYNVTAASFLTKIHLIDPCKIVRPKANANAIFLSFFLSPLLLRLSLIPGACVHAGSLYAVGAAVLFHLILSPHRFAHKN